VLSSSFDTFKAALTEENRTLKRALTDPRILSGIGNAYSDEILHAAQLSPLALTHKLKPEEWTRLYRGDAQDTLRYGSTAWSARPARISRESHRVPQGDGGAWPLWQAVPAMRRSGAAHPLRRQRDELLCALPDGRQASRRSRPVALLGADWPRTLDELEALKRR
jgi:formamidopyrimidine-DNA glycosylase